MSSEYEDNIDEAIKLFCSFSRISYPHPIVIPINKGINISIYGIENKGNELMYSIKVNDIIHKKVFNHENDEKGSKETIERIISIISHGQNISEVQACEKLIVFLTKELDRAKNR